MLINRNTTIGRIALCVLAHLPRFVPIYAEHARVGSDTTSFIVIKFN